MTDPPKPPRPRPEAFPPPLPGSLQGEPFLPAKDPEFRMRSTPPSGSLLLNREVEQLSTEDQRDQIIRELRQTLVLYREKLADAAVAPSPVPVTAPPMSIRTRSRVALAGIVTGKYTIAISAAALLARAIAKHYPNWAESVELFLQGFGL